MEAEVSETRVVWFRTRGGKPGPTRKALDTALDAQELTGLDLVTAEIARAAAELTDSARQAQDPRLWLASSQRLLTLVSKIRPAGDGATGPVGGADLGDEPVEPDGLESALGAGPSLGDAEEP